MPIDVPIHLHNTLSRRKELFRPIDPAKVRLYVCGPTVYDYAHIGNARPVVVFDVLYRLLRLVYGKDKVRYARNVTDVDDKIMAAAKATGEAIGEVTGRTLAAFHEDMAALGALPPDFEPRATETIPEMIALIERLIARGHAYEAEGHVLFDVPSWPGYGALSGNRREEIVAGARIDVAPYKKDAADYVLWKPSTAEQPGWDSPWGHGRPGWHIECSAMSEKFLAPLPFDIHGGGLDLIFPHHENEIAQSVCAHEGAETGADFARYWMHNGYVTVGGEKMSKSLGNFVTVRELLDEGLPGEAIRLALLSGHYRQPLDVTRESVRQARARLDRYYRAKERVLAAGASPATPGSGDPFVAALAEDLNSPQALSVLDGEAHDIQRTEGAGLAETGARFLGHAALFGLLWQEPEYWFRGADAGGGPDDSEIERLIAERLAARKARDFARADEIRASLAGHGIVLEDGAGGTVWRRAG
jgi:cysteinyl-tRNA synthetase